MLALVSLLLITAVFASPVKRDGQVTCSPSGKMIPIDDYNAALAAVKAMDPVFVSTHCGLDDEGATPVYDYAKSGACLVRTELSPGAHPNADCKMPGDVAAKMEDIRNACFTSDVSGTTDVIEGRWQGDDGGVSLVKV